MEPHKKMPGNNVEMFPDPTLDGTTPEKNVFIRKPVTDATHEPARLICQKKPHIAKYLNEEKKQVSMLFF